MSDLSLLRQTLTDKIQRRADSMCQRIHHREDYGAEDIFRPHLARHLNIMQIMARLCDDPGSWQDQDIIYFQSFWNDLNNTMSLLRDGSRYDSKFSRQQRRVQGLQIKQTMDDIEILSEDLMRLHALSIVSSVQHSIVQASIIAEMLEDLSHDPLNLDDISRTFSISMAYEENEAIMQQYEDQKSSIDALQALASSEGASAVTSTLLRIVHNGLGSEDIQLLNKAASNGLLTFGPRHKKLPVLHPDGTTDSLQSEIQHFLHLHRARLISVDNMSH